MVNNFLIVVEVAASITYIRLIIIPTTPDKGMGNLQLPPHSHCIN